MLSVRQMRVRTEFCRLTTQQGREVDMVRWQVQDRAWREESHGGNEVYMSERLAWRFFVRRCYIGKVQLCTDSCIILALGKRVLVIYGGPSVLGEQKNQAYFCIEIILNPNTYVSYFGDDAMICQGRKSKLHTSLLLYSTLPTICNSRHGSLRT